MSIAEYAMAMSIAEYVIAFNRIYCVQSDVYR